MAFEEAKETAKVLSAMEQLAASKVKSFKAGKLSSLAEVDYKKVRELLDSYVKNNELSFFFRYYNPDNIGEYFDFKDAREIPINSYYTSKTTGEEFFISEDDEFELWYQFSDKLYHELIKDYKHPKAHPSDSLNHDGVSPSRVKIDSRDKYTASQTLVVQKFIIGIGEFNMSATYNNNGTVNGAFGEKNKISNNRFDINEVKNNNEKISQLLDDLCKQTSNKEELKNLSLEAKNEYDKTNYSEVYGKLSVIKELAKTTQVALPALATLLHLFGL